MGQSVLLRAFSSGELDPGLSVRGDLDVYGRGLRTCRNFIVRRSGGVTSRPGLEHVATCKDDDPTYLLAYIFVASDECYVIEAGDLYFRFHHRLRGMVFELETPYTLDMLPTLGWAQTGAQVVLTHRSVLPMELIKGPPFSDTFTLTPAPLVPVLDPPTVIAVTAGVVGTGTFSYVITSVQRGTYEESIASLPVVLIDAGVGLPETPHHLAWGFVEGAVEYRIYRAEGVSNTFGYLGTATEVEEFSDIGLAIDYAFTPPQVRPIFDDPLDYPAKCAMHQQRRIYAASHNHPDLIHASRTGLRNNFTTRSPLQDDDGVTWRTISVDLQVIQHVISLGPLLVLTDRGEWVCRGDSEGGLTPTTIYPEQVGYVGASLARPVIYGNRVLFTQSRNVTVREWVIGARNEGLSGRDLTVGAAHLFRDTTIAAMAFSLIPDPVLWIVRSDGVLLGLTYVPDENVLAWHHHDTADGLFEDVMVIPEPQEDAVYVIVNRDGTRSLERMGIRGDPTRKPALDQVVRYRGPATTEVGGLAHLVGRTVVVTSPGAETRRAVVSALGTVTLPAPREVVDVGLSITADLETLDLDAAGSDVRDRRKKVTALAFLVEKSLQNFSAGPDADHLLPVAPAPWQDPAAPVSGRIELAPNGTFNDEGRVFLRHTEPTTLTVLGVFPTVDIGG